jgi:hypothetical protein
MLIHSAEITGSVQFNNTDVSGITNVSGFATTSSVNTLIVRTGSYATTGSNQFNGNQSISGSITSNGTITAQTLVVQTVTSSIEFVTGSTRNGSLASNTHEFTGSVSVTGSLIANDVSVGKGGGNITNNIAVGSQAMQSNTTGNYNTAFGASASYTNVVSNYNTSVGFRALFSNTSSFNTAIGSLALADNASGTGNTAVGFQALNFNTTANYNTAVGSNALFKTTTGNGNTAVGRLANYQNTTGYANSSIGNEALYENTTGFGNTALGSLALQKNTVGTNNIAIGSNAGSNISGGFATNISSTSSIFIGNNTAASASGQTNQIVIGHDVVGLGSNTTILGTSSTITTALYGNLGIGTTSPNFNSYGTALTLLSSLNYGGIEVYGSGSTKGGQIDFGSGNIRYASISGEYESSDNGFIQIRTRRAGTMTDAVRITSSGSVGIGTTSPTTNVGLTVKRPTGTGFIIDALNSSNTRVGGFYSTGGGNGQLYLANNAGTETIVLDSAGASYFSGSVGIGTTNPTFKLEVSSSGDGISVTTSNSSQALRLSSATNNNTLFRINNFNGNFYDIQNQPSDNSLVIDYNDTERIRITSIGTVGIGTSSPARGLHLAAGGYILSGGVPYVGAYTSDGLYGATATPNFIQATGTGGLLLGYQDNGNGLYSPAYSFEVKSIDGRPVGGIVVKGIIMKDLSTGTQPFFVNNNGNVANANNSYGSTSDISLKENITDTTPKLEDLLKVKIRNYNLKSNPNLKQIGVIAQELEDVFPSMIDIDIDGIKSVKYSVFVPMLVKAIQELKAEIEILKQQ